MKKTIYFKILLSLTMFFCIAISNINAAYNPNSGDQILVCEYTNGSKVQAQIYYLGRTNYSGQKGPWNVVYRRYQSDGLIYLENFYWVEQYSYGSFKRIFQGFYGAIHYRMRGGTMPDNMKTNFQCPPYQYVDYNNWNELCFTDQSTCGQEFGNSKDDRGPHYLTENSIFKEIDNYVDATYDNITYDDWPTIDKDDLRKLLISRVTEHLNSKYKTFLDWNGGSFPKFIKNYINSIQINLEKFDVLAEKIVQETTEMVENGELTEDEVQELEKNLQLIRDNIGNIITVNPGNDPDCDGLLGRRMTDIINNVFSFIRYLGPVLVGVFSIIDYFKAAFSGEQEDMNKAAKKVPKRVVCAILLFFIPLVVKLIFEVAGVTVPDFCIE